MIWPIPEHDISRNGLYKVYSQIYGEEYPLMVKKPGVGEMASDLGGI